MPSMKDNSTHPATYRETLARVHEDLNGRRARSARIMATASIICGVVTIAFCWLGMLLWPAILLMVLSLCGGALAILLKRYKLEPSRSTSGLVACSIGFALTLALFIYFRILASV